MKPSRYVDDPSFTRKYDVRLALVLGDRAATFVQQVHYHARWKEEQFGMLEWRSSMSEWKNTFPHWSEDTIKRIVKELKTIGILKTRRGTFRGRDAVWFSLDYEKIDEIGDEGHEQYREALKRIEKPRIQEEEDEQEVQIAPHTGSKMHPAGGANCTLTGVQNAPHQINLSTTSGSTIANGRGAAAPLVCSPATTRQKEMQNKVRQKHRSTLEKRFETKESYQSIETWWNMIVSDHHGKGAVYPLSAADRRNSKLFITWCKKADVNLLHFIEWCSVNWVRLRDHAMRWAKLSATPTYRSIYALKERFLEHYRANGGSIEDQQAREHAKEVYTDISQVPLHHPQYKQIKILIERQGRAEA